MAEEHNNSRRTTGLQRRRMLVVGSALALAGCTSGAVGESSKGRPGSDAALLANLIGLERGAVAAYTKVLAGSLLGPAQHDLAESFRQDHAKHAEALLRAFARIGGSGLGDDATQGAAASFSLSGRGDVLRFLCDLEQGLALAHLAAVPAFAGRDLAKGAGGILSVESIHWATWRSALGEGPVPAPILG